MPDSLRMLINAINSLPNSIIVFDMNGNLIDANRTACVLHGVDQVHDIENCEETKKVVGKALSGDFCTMEYQIVDKTTGRERWLKAHCNPVYADIGGDPVGVSIVEKDITSHKMIIKELMKLRGAP